MNICHVVPIYLPGILPGCSKYVRDISKELIKRGHHLTVVTSNAITGRGWVDPLFGKYSSVKEETIQGVRVRRLKTRWQVTSTMHLLKTIANGFLPRSIEHVVSLLSAGPYLSNLKEEIQGERYEVIHVTAFPFTLIWLVRKACESVKKPFVCTPLIHFEDPRHHNPHLWKSLQEAAAVIACSHYERAGMIRKGIHPSRIHLIPMGIDLDEWTHPDGERVLRKYHLEGRKVLLFAGTKDYDKGAISLLQAVAQARHRVKDLILVTIGLSTREWENGKTILPERNLLDLGYVSEQEKRDLFAACDLFAMPSRYDSFGIVYLEAWRCGKPVIGARVGAIPEVIEDQKDGLLVEFGNVDQLTSAIGDLLDHPERGREMGERGRQKVIERYNWQNNIAEMERVYQGARIEW